MDTILNLFDHDSGHSVDLQKYVCTPLAVPGGSTVGLNWGLPQSRLEW